MNFKGKRYYTREEIMKALSPDGEQINPIEEMIATIKAVFTIVRLIDMDPRAKKVLAQYEKQFQLYLNLLEQKKGQAEVQIKKISEDDNPGFISLN